VTDDRRTLRLPPSDTAPEVETLVIEGYRRMTPAEKLRCIGDMRQAALWMAAAGIRARHGASVPEPELRLRVAALNLDRELMIAAFGWDPAERGY
jgi:hypothetical protein